MKKMGEKCGNRKDTAEIPVGFPDKRNFPSGKSAEKCTHWTESERKPYPAGRKRVF